MKTFNIQTKIKPLIIWLIFLRLTPLNAQDPLTGYINEGLQNNVILQQKNISLEKAMYSLKEANSLFLPSVNINSSYTSGQGGRYFNFPLGDMLNPIYRTLNQMTESNQFPQIENQEAYLNPYNFYDVHARTTLPIVNTDLIYNKKIQKQQIQLQEFEVDIYKRELVKQIKTAYFNYLMAAEGVKVYKSALELVKKNVEVNESLLRNGKGLPASVLRAQSEAESIQSELLHAESNLTNAGNYLNFLLNKPLDSPIDINYNSTEALTATDKYINESNIEQREELQQIKTGIEVYNSQLKMNRLFWTPKINSFLDLGSQGVDWTFNNKSRYYLFGVQMDIPVFNGLRNNYKISKSKLDLKSAELNEQLLRQKISMSLEMEKNNLKSLYKEYQSSLKHLHSAQSYFRLIETGYKEGTNSLIEFIDARNQLTTSELKVNINKYKVLQALASVERETGSYSFNK